jgi:transcriptional regulator with XRE-family HTH domain
MPDDDLSIAARLKEAREYLGLSQQEVAASTGLSRSAISLIETGQRKLSAQELKTFSRVYQRPVGYFTGEEATAYSEDINMLARKASTLSERDRSELMRFTQFLMQRSQSGDPDGKA